MMKFLLQLKKLSNGAVIAGIGVAVLLLYFLFGALPKGLPTFLIAVAVGGPLIYLGIKSYWQEHEIQKLLQANAFLKMSKRMAVISDIKKSEENGVVKTTFTFTELDPSEEPYGPKREFTIEGRCLYIDSMVIKFEDKYIEKGDDFKGKALCLIRRLFSEKQRPDDGFPIDPEGQTPQACVSDNARFQQFQETLWAEFWKLAQDPEYAHKKGVRATHGSAPYMQLEEGATYKLEMRTTGELTIKRQ